jgi:hypothetical protein
MAARYTISFKGVTGDACVFTIFDTTFNGAVTALDGGSSSPVVITHEGDEQDIFSRIVATSCELNYINNGVVPISTFETADATRFTCEFTVAGQTKFKGVLSLDDLSERVVIAPNECRLTFTDGIGLLKNYTMADTALTPLTGRYRLTAILQAILAKTGLSLPLYTFANIYEQDMTNRGTSNTADPVYQAGVNVRSFLKNSTDEDIWENCYDILDKILQGLQLRIFQESGVWNVVRIVETINNPAGTHYSNTGTIVGPLSNKFSPKTDLDAVEFSQVKFLKRAARKLIQTFQYEYPQLLRNANLSKVGNLRGTIVDGSNTISRYDVVDMTLNQTQDAEIRVVRVTSTGRELDRYLYLYFNSNLRAAVAFLPIEADSGDGFRLSFRYKGVADSNFSGEFRAGLFFKGYSGKEYIAVGNLQLSIMYWVETLTDTETNWQSLGQIYLRGSDDLTSFRNVDIDIESEQAEALTFPEDGEFFIGIYGWNNNASRRADVDAQIENIRFEYVKFIMGGQNVRGHEHIISQTTDYNREEQEDLFIDDSPATSIRGTLFVMGGSTPNRTVQWSDDTANFYRLGEVNALRRMEIEGVTRYGIQGNFYGVASLYDLVQFSFMAGRKFLPTVMTIDYRRCTTEGTFIEVDGPINLQSSTYEYKNLFE